MEQVELEEVETVCHDRVGSLSSFLKLFDDDIVASDALEVLIEYKERLSFWAHGRLALPRARIIPLAM